MLTLYGVVVPAPVIDSLACELEALLENERDPDTVPVLFGVKATLKATLWPDVIVNGNEVPSITNWELLLDAEEMVTLAPTALMVKGRVSVVPTLTLP